MEGIKRIRLRTFTSILLFIVFSISSTNGKAQTSDTTGIKMLSRSIEMSTVKVKNPFFQQIVDSALALIKVENFEPLFGRRILPVIFLTIEEEEYTKLKFVKFRCSNRHEFLRTDWSSKYKLLLNGPLQILVNYQLRDKIWVQRYLEEQTNKGAFTYYLFKDLADGSTIMALPEKNIYHTVDFLLFNKESPRFEFVKYTYELNYDNKIFQAIWED